MEQKKIPSSYLADWYATLYYGNIIWSKFDIAHAQDLGLKYIPKNHESSKPQKGYTLWPKSQSVEIELTLERHVQTKPNGKKVWFYPAILEDIYDQTGKLYFKDELKLPPVSEAKLTAEKYAPWTDSEKVKEILTTPNLDNPVHRFILNLAFDKEGNPLEHTKELIPDVSNMVPPALMLVDKRHIPKNITEHQRNRLNSGNPIIAALEILKEEKILVNTLSILEKKEELDEATTLML